MGVEGASIATAVSILASTLYLFLHIQKGKNHFNFHHFRFTLKLDNWKALLTVGLPSFASEHLFLRGLLLINHSIVAYGPLAVAAFGLVNYISFIFIRLFTAAMIASLPIMSFNIGAKLPQRVLNVFLFALGFTVLLGGVMTVLGFLAPDWLVAVFSSNESDAFKQVASSAVGLYFLLFIAAGPNYVLGAYLQSIGKSVASTLINVLKGVVLIAFFLLLLPDYFQLGLSGIWLSRSLAEILTFVLIGLYTFLNKERYYSDRAILARA